MGFVPAEYRGGFVDFWEAANALEHTSHPYEGAIYDADGKEIRFSGVYRTDFLTQRAIRFLREVGKDPFLLVIFYLEPHYYGCVARLDENLGEILKTLSELGRLDDTIIVFTSDHGCHFRTRNAEYKRSAHEGSVRIPLVIACSVFNRSLVVPEVVSLVGCSANLA